MLQQTRHLIHMNCSCCLGSLAKTFGKTLMKASGRLSRSQMFQT